jgi:tetratricopeptide (TPR) repeat protein
MPDLLGQLREALTGTYRIDAEIGSGGMAVVFGAADLKHDRRVALKVMRPEISSSVGSDRFLREIRIAAKLSHPHIVPLFDSGEAAGLLYYVMPFIDGESLQDRLERTGPLEIREALQVVREAGSALSHAHKQGIVHRDVKPGNILLSGGHAVVSDFGIAAAVTDAGGESLTRTGISVGTPDYMSPEQAAGDQSVDARSDEYSLGCVLYEMLTGQPPFTGPTAMAVLARHSLDPVPSVRTLRGTVPAGLEASMNRALEKIPADRFPTMEKFVEAVTGDHTGERPRSRGSRRAASLARVGWGVAAIAVIVAVALMVRPYDFSTLFSSGPEEELVAMLDFEDMGGLGELSYLTRAIPEFLATALADGKSGTRAIDRRQVTKAWDRIEGLTLDPVGALERVAADVGATQVVSGQIIAQPNDRVLAQATLIRGREEVARAAVTLPADQAIAVAESLGVQLLAGSAGQFERLPGLVSSSTAAVQEWISGMEAFRRGDWSDAMAQFSGALDQDSTFALAAWGLMMSAGWQAGVSDAYRRGRRLAWAHRDRLPSPDSAVFVAESRRNGYPEPPAGGEREVLALYERTLSQYPHRWETWFHHGDFLWHEGGAYADDGRRRAVRSFQQAIALDSTAHAEPWEHLIEHYVETGDEEGFRAIPDRYRDLTYRFFDLLFAAVDPKREISEEDWQLISELYFVPGNALMELQALGGGMQDAESLADILVQRAADGDGNAGKIAGNFALNLGQPGRALPLLRVAESGEECMGRPCQHSEMWLLAGTYWDADPGVVAAVRDSLEAALASLTADQVLQGGRGERRRLHERCWLGITGQIAGRTGSFLSALALAREVEARSSDFRTVRLARLCAAVLAAQQAVESGHPEAETMVLAADSIFGIGANQRYQAAWHVVLSDLYASVGQTEKALGLMRRFWIVAGEERTQFLSARLLRRARLAAELGYREEALRSYEHYLWLRSDPEPVLEEKVATVRTEYEMYRGS